MFTAVNNLGDADTAANSIVTFFSDTYSSRRTLLGHAIVRVAVTR
jgi:hypothetical protein